MLWESQNQSTLTDDTERTKAPSWQPTSTSRRGRKWALRRFQPSAFKSSNWGLTCHGAEISQLYSSLSKFLTHGTVSVIRVILCHSGVISFTAIVNVALMHYNHILCKKFKIFAAETSCSPAKAPWVQWSLGPIPSHSRAAVRHWERQGLWRPHA